MLSRAIEPGEAPSAQCGRTAEAAAVDQSRRPLAIAAIITLAAVPYLNILLNGFVYDDHTQITSNPYLRDFRHLHAIFTTTVWSYMGAEGLTNYYRPLMTLSYAAGYRLFGPLAYGFHLLSLLLHVTAALLVFAVAERVTRDRAWALAAGALFAIHPIHTESVAWIAAVTDVELTVFALLTFYFFTDLDAPSTTKSIGGVAVRTAGMAAAFVFALLSKEQALMLPVLATVYEYACRGDRLQTGPARKLARHGPLWLIAAAYLLWRVHFIGAFAPVHQMGTLAPAQVVLSALALVGAYAGKLLWPARLCAFYIFHPHTRIADPQVLAGAAALGALVVLFLVLMRSREPHLRFAAFAVAWFLVTLAPVLNARWMAANVFAERYLYLPSVGFCWALAGVFSWLWRRTAGQATRRRALLAGSLALVALATLRITTRNHDWRDDVALYTRTLKQSPGAYPILNNLGTVYWQHGRADDAERVWRQALAVAPNGAIVLNNLGLVASGRKQYASAVELFRRAIALKPEFTDPHLNLGSAERALGLRATAEAEFRRATALSPLNDRAHRELGELLLDERRLEEAADEFRVSLRASPTAPAWDDLGEADLLLNHTGAAEQAWRAALRLDPLDSCAHFSLGRIYMTQDRRGEALDEYRAGLVTDPHNANALAAIAVLTSPANGKP
ncbi:MAG TPA: tetratricopeptide repeat protein [Terriglobia bacterium]|nr:tetratricopeptide repeat protein [Terriglobia bacterium]